MTIPVLSTIALPKLASAPGSPNEGDYYYDTTLHKVGFYDGTTWVYGSAGGTGSRSFAYFAS